MSSSLQNDVEHIPSMCPYLSLRAGWRNHCILFLNLTAQCASGGHLVEYSGYTADSLWQMVFSQAVPLWSLSKGTSWDHDSEWLYGRHCQCVGQPFCSKLKYHYNYLQDWHLHWQFTDIHGPQRIHLTHFGAPWLFLWAAMMLDVDVFHWNAWQLGWIIW